MKAHYLTDADTALLRRALEALEEYPYMSNKDDHDRLGATIAALRERLEPKTKESK